MKFWGKYRALVTDIKDVKNMGRIMVQCPSVFGESESQWCIPCVPFTGDGHGIMFLPAVGDVVWIEFEEGDIEKPIWVGSWWGLRKAPLTYSEVANKRIIKTRSGNEIVLEDTEGGENIFIQDKNGNSILMNKDGITIRSCKDFLFVNPGTVKFNDN
jgi:uncharacterized protein involved in type VI secretion and phage assembly